jgi:signal transduction histidine kinase
MNPLNSLMGKGAFFRSNVARRIFLLFILCALIPLSVLAYFSFSQVTKNLYVQANESLHQTSKASGMATFERLQFLETDLGMIGAILEKGNNDLRALPVPGLQERLSARFKSIVLTAGKGRTKILLGRMPVIPQLTKHEQDHVHSGKTLVLTRLVTEPHASIFMVKTRSPLHASRDLLFGEVNPGYVWDSESFISPLTELFVLDQSHNVLFSSFPEYLPLQEIKNAMQKDPSVGRFTWTYGNESFLASYWNLFMVPQFHANWIVVQSETTTDILAPIGNFKSIFLSLVLLTFLIAVFLSLIQIRKSLVPIELLREATRKFGEKKFESRVTINTNDEFEELGRSFNEMAASLEDHLQIIRKSSEELREANKKLETLDKLKSNLVTTVSHELRTPLTSIKANAELILMKPALQDEKKLKLLKVINDESDRLSRLINDLLDLSRIEAGTVQWHTQQVSLNEVIPLSVEAVLPLAQNKGLDLTTSLVGTLPAILGDKDRLVQLVTNLLSNAIKFTPSGGSVTITAHQEQTPLPRLVVTVSDTGIGIPPEDITLIFDKFHRASHSMTDETEGTGLGLAIARQIVELFGGKIWASSTQGSGSTFTFTLPLTGNITPAERKDR